MLADSSWFAHNMLEASRAKKMQDTISVPEANFWWTFCLRFEMSESVPGPNSTKDFLLKVQSFPRSAKTTKENGLVQSVFEAQLVLPTTFSTSKPRWTWEFPDLFECFNLWKSPSLLSNRIGEPRWSQSSSNLQDVRMPPLRWCRDVVRKSITPEASFQEMDIHIEEKSIPSQPSKTSNLTKTKVQNLIWRFLR